MGALNILLRSAIDAIEEVGKGDDYQNDGYHFKADTTTRSVDDITIKAGSNEFVLACVWKTYLTINLLYQTLNMLLITTDGL